MNKYWIKNAIQDSVRRVGFSYNKCNYHIHFEPILIKISTNAIKGSMTLEVFEGHIRSLNFVVKRFVIFFIDFTLNFFDLFPTLFL